MQSSKPAERLSTSIAFQIFWIVVSALFITWLFTVEYKSFHSEDFSPQLFSITPKQARIFGGAPTTVKTGVTINNFSVFDTLTNNFELQATIWFEFDPRLISLETISHFYIEKGDITSKSAPLVKEVGEKLLASYDVKVKKSDNLVHTFFPFNGFTFHLVINNRTTPAELVFEASAQDVQLAPGLITPGWMPVAKRAETGYYVATLSNKKSETLEIAHPRVVFSIDFDLDGLRRLITIILPLIIIFYITIFSFSMDANEHARSLVTISSASITGLIAYRFVIENLSPRVGYFMLTDYIYFLFLFACGAIFLANTKSLELSNRAKEFITVLIHSTVLFVLFFLFKYWLYWT